MLRAMRKSVPLLILFISCARATVNTPPATLSEPREAVEFGRIAPDPCTTRAPQQSLSATAPKSSPPLDLSQPRISEPLSFPVDQESLAAEKRRVLGLRAPRYSGSGERDDAFRFMKGDFEQWIKRRVPATNAIIKRYEQAQSNAKSPARAARLAGDIAELHLEFCREWVSGGQSAMPLDIRNDTEHRKAFAMALVVSVGDHLDLAERWAANCLEKASDDDAELASRCRIIRTDVEAIRCLR